MFAMQHNIPQAVTKVIYRMVEIREGELGKTLLMSLFFFLVIFSVTVVKPVRNSIFLSELGASKLPYVYLATAAFTGLLVLIDSKLSNVLNRVTFLSTTIGFLLLNLLVFWWLVQRPEKWIPATFYVWINFFTYLLVAHFWGFASNFFNPREAKRLYGLILTVGTFGGIAGGLAADLSVQTIFSTEDVLLIAAAALLLSIGLIQLIEKVVRRKTVATDPSRLNAKRILDSTKTFDRGVDRRHLRLLGIMIILAVIVSTLIDYQFNSIVEKSYPTKFAKTEFFGEFFALLNAISLFMQFFLTSKILKKFGIGITLVLLPLILSFSSMGFLFLPTILLASFLKISDKTLSYSLMQSSRELLFLPISSEIRVKAKLFIDVFINRFASGLAAGLIIFFTVVFPLTVEQLSFVTLIFTGAWMVTAVALRKEYISSIKRLLIRRDVDIEERVIQTLDAETIDTLVLCLKSKDANIIRYALSLLELVPSKDISDKIKPLLQHWDAKVRAHALRILCHSGGKDMLELVNPYLLDEDTEVRIEAIHFVCAYSEVSPMARMEDFLEDTDPRIRASAVACMINHSRRITPKGMAILNKMLEDSSEYGDVHRMEAAKALGVIDHGFDLHRNLLPLFEDSSHFVQQAAIESAGKVPHNWFVELLIFKLRIPRLRKYARDALANYGNRILPQLKHVLADPEQNHQIRKNIPRVLYQIKTDESWNVLIENLAQKNTTIRYEAIKALNKIRKYYPDWEINQRKVHDTLMAEIRNYYWKLNIFHAYGRKERILIDVREVDDILYPALIEKLDEGLDRIFRLLALIYPQQDIYNSYYYLTQGNVDEKANALEYLDNLLPTELRARLLPILDDLPLNHKVRQGRALFNLKKLTRKKALAALLDNGDLWLEVCTVYSLGREKIRDFEAKVYERLNSNELILRQTAERCLKMI